MVRGSIQQRPERRSSAGCGVLGARWRLLPRGGFPEARPCHGHEEIAAFLSEYLAAWETYAYTVADAIAVGDDRVLIHGDIDAAGRTSGLALEGHTHHCFWLRHGRFIRQEDHLSAKGALYALGLAGDSLEAAGRWE